MTLMPKLIYKRDCNRERKFLLNTDRKTLFYLNNFKRPHMPFINLLNLRFYSETKKDNELALNVLNQFLTTIHTENKIRPKIMLSRQGKLASEVLKTMIRTLECRNSNNSSSNYKGISNDQVLLNFIKEYYKLPIYVFNKEKDGILYSDYEYNLPLKFRQNTNRSTILSEDSDKDIFLFKKMNEAGIYLFRHESGKIAIGSAINFQRRLTDHMSSFNNHIIQENLHKFAQNNGGI